MTLIAVTVQPSLALRCGGLHTSSHVLDMQLRLSPVLPRPGMAWLTHCHDSPQKHRVLFFQCAERARVSDHNALHLALRNGRPEHLGHCRSKHWARGGEAQTEEAFAHAPAEAAAAIPYQGLNLQEQGAVMSIAFWG